MKKYLIVLALIVAFSSNSFAADYIIKLSELEDQAVTYKAQKENKTKAEIFNTYVRGTLIAQWIREKLDAESLTLKEKYEKATQIEKDQIKIILRIP